MSLEAIGNPGGGNVISAIGLKILEPKSMKNVDFVFVDLFDAAAEWDRPFRSLVIGPASYGESEERLRDNLRFLHIGTTCEPVRCGAPGAADQFLSIFDSRRMRRAWQDSEFIAVDCDVEQLARATEHMFPFIVSEPARFDVISGTLAFRPDSNLMRKSDISTAVWRRNQQERIGSRFLADVEGIPLAIRLRSEGDDFYLSAVLRITDTAACAAQVITVQPICSKQRIKAKWEVLYRNAVIATLSDLT